MTDPQAHRPTASDIAASPPLASSYLEDPRLPNGLVVSSYGRRLLAMLFDVLLTIDTIGIGWLIWTLFTYRDGQTPAKKLMKMRVVDVRTGTPYGWGQTFVREFLVKGIVMTVISTITFGIGWLVGALLILSGEMHQTLWDRMMKSTVADDDVSR